MAKIIKIEERIVSIGNDDGTIIKAFKKDFTFEPEIGDEVEVFSTGTEMIISKIMPKIIRPSKSEEDININIVNGTSPYQRGKVVNKWVYLLITFFLGVFGGHKFYAGKTFVGVLYLLFCWTGVPGFFAICSCIYTLCRRADVNGNIIV
ncbi:hypothetical protein AwErysi_01480 [Erysipelotrichaceae bacterium]|nr:hypothetical protein AwErysi_01480 [Erysipelotrichaceae bacterium]